MAIASSPIGGGGGAADAEVTWAKRHSPQLTLRGWALLGIGLAATSATVSANQQDLARVAAFLVILPLLSWLYIVVASGRWHVKRQVAPKVVSPGESVAVRLVIERPQRGAALIVTEQALPFVGGDRRFHVDSWVRGPITVSFPRPVSLRGVWRIGPMTAMATDPLGLATQQWSVASEADIVALPVRHTLPMHLQGSGAQGSGHGAGNNVAVTGEPDYTVRAFRPGDGLRLVHWRSTARRGKLMVRNTRHKSPTVVALVVDTRRLAHFGAAAQSSLEWVLSMAASFAESMADQECEMHLIGCGPSQFINPGDARSRHNAFETMARQDVVDDPNQLIDALGAASALPNVSFVMAVTGVLTTDDHAALMSVAGTIRAGRALVVQPDPVDGFEPSDVALAPVAGTRWQVLYTTPACTVPQALGRLSATFGGATSAAAGGPSAASGEEDQA